LVIAFYNTLFRSFNFYDFFQENEAIVSSNDVLVNEIIKPSNVQGNSPPMIKTITQPCTSTPSSVNGNISTVDFCTASQKCGGDLKQDILDKSELKQVAQDLQNNEIKGSLSMDKPPFTYSQMIIQAIVSSPEKRLKLKEIYQYINTTYPCYHMDTEMWKNRIRHNLSIQKYFFQMPLLKKYQGRGGYWQLSSDKEFEKIIAQCFKEKPRPKNWPISRSSFVRHAQSSLSSPATQQNVSTNAGVVQQHNGRHFITTSTKQPCFNTGLTGQNVVPITNAATAALKQQHQHYQQSSSNVGFHSQAAGNIKLVAAPSSIQHHPPVTTHLSIASLTNNNIASSLPHSSQQSQHQPTGSFKVAVCNINNATTSTNVVSSQQQVHLGLSYQHPQHAHMLSATSQLPSRVTNTSGQPNVQMEHLQPIHMTQRERMTHDRLGPISLIRRKLVPVFERAALPVAHFPTTRFPVVHRIQGPLPSFFRIPTPSTIAHQPAGLLPIVDQVSNSATALNEQTSKTTTATAVLPVVEGQKRPLSEAGPEAKKMRLPEGN